MHQPTRPLRKLPSAPVLLLALVITTGWGDATASHVRPAGAHAIDVPGAAQRSEAAALRWESSLASVTDDVVSTLLGARASRHEVALATAARERADAAAAAAAKAKADAARAKARAERQKSERQAERAKVERSKRDEPAQAKPTYAGSNRFWIPSLGISNRVHLFECSRQRPPDNYMYRWGCAGQNNIYIMGHAYSVMQPLHDAYVRGRLKVGMIAIYANGNGTVTRYRVTEWRVVDPVDSHWAIADQPVPSMTLQTCVGKDGALRLNVRLVAVD